MRNPLSSPRPTSLLLTGASSGIGAALARAYAGPGVHLALTGRDGARLGAVADECRRAGALVLAETVDSVDRGAIGHFIRRADAASALDLVIANAGVSAGTGGQGETEAQARRIFAVNLDGVLNTVHPAIAAMRPRRRGQVALMSSLAAFRGFAGAPAYSASKAAVRIYGEALRGALAADGIGVSVICPGFVESRMTAVNRFPMPLLMPAERAAGIIMRGLAANRGRIAFPWPTYAVAWLLGTLPPGLTDALIRVLPRKGSA